MNNASFTRAYFEQQGRAGASAVSYANNRVLCRAINRFKMFVSSKDTTVGPHLALDGIWEAWVTACLFNNLHAGMSCFNVGANVGYFTLIMGAHVGPKGRVWAFECNPETFELCRDNVILNGMDAWVDVLERAGSDKCSTASFQFDSALPGSACIVRDGGRSDWQTIQVKTATVDSIVGDEQLDFLMIDAEGSEPAVIDGAEQTIKANPQIQLLLEWAPDGWGAHGGERLAEKLLGWGFRPMRVGVNGERQPITDIDLIKIPTWDMIWFRRPVKC